MYSSRGAVWQNGVWHGSAYAATVWNWISPRGKNDSSMLVECWWRPNSGCECNEVSVNTMRQWVVCFSSGRISSGSPPLVHIFMSTACQLLFITGENAWWWWLHWKIVFCSWEFPLWSSVIVLFVSIVVSMEINTGCYFWSNPHSPCSSAFELTAVFIQA